MHGNDFTKGPVGKQIITFSIPIILGNLFMQLYQVVDSVIVGRYLGKEALAAVGASMPVVFAVIALAIGIGSGASVVISQYFGAKQHDKVQATSDTLHIFLLGAGVLIAVLGFFFNAWILKLTGLPEDLIPMAEQYLIIFLGGIFLLFGFNTVTSILRGIGDSRTPLMFLVISTILNIVMDLLFVVVFGWGVPGAAWATIVASGAAYAIALIYINRRGQIIKINLLKLKFNSQIFKQCIKYGLPTGIQQSVVAIGGLVLMAVINPFGTTVIAGYTIAMRIDALATIPAINFAVALAGFVGQNVGAGHQDRAKKGLGMTLLYSSLTCMAFTLVIILFGRNILGLFTTDSDVIAVGLEYLVIVSSFYLLFSAMLTFNGMFRGSGAVIFPMFSTLFSLWIIRIPVALWLSRSMGSEGIWWSIPIGWAVGLAMVLVYYKTGKWKNHSIFDSK